VYQRMLQQTRSCRCSWPPTDSGMCVPPAVATDANLQMQLAANRQRDVGNRTRSRKGKKCIRRDSNNFNYNCGNDCSNRLYSSRTCFR
jgi:hypothetical protein